MPKQRRPLEERRPVRLTKLSWPSIRNRPGQTGLDPMDTYREEGSFWGYILSRLLRLKVRTRNPFLIVLMFLAAVSLIGCVLAGFIPNSFSYSAYIMGTGICFIPLGILLLVNAVVSLRDLI